MMKNGALKQILLVVFLILGLGLTGCEDEGEQYDPRFRDIISDIDEVQFQITQEMILKSSTPRDKAIIRQHLRSIRDGFIRLSRDQRDELGYALIKRAVKAMRYDFIQVLERDRATLTPLIQGAVEQATRAAEEVGIRFKVDWSIYSFRFSEPLEKEGFVSWPQGAWQVDWALDRSYVSTRGQDSDAWLIAPAMDLREVENPTFRIVHTININSNSREKIFDRQAFLSKSFRARISLNYRGGDPDPEKCGCQWEELDLGKLPSSKDFHTVESPEIDLSRFRGENVSIAIYYDTRRLPKHYVNWNISLFEVAGAGTYESSTGRVVKTLLAYDFGKKRLDPFQVLTQTPESLQWETGGREGSYEWAVVKNRAGNKEPFQRTSSLLLSPIFVIENGKKPVLSITEVINYIGTLNLDELKILISPDYQGGNILDANWIPVERDPELEIPEKSWGDIVTFGVELGELPNSQFTLLFWFDSKTESNMVWELKNFSLEAKGGVLKARHFKSAPYIPPLESEGGLIAN